ncbi:MAG: GntR family transcriptional regulator [Pseudomonadota bacterium]
MLKETAAVSNKVPENRPVHENVYAVLRARVLFGDLVPGQAVTLQGLADHLHAGMTPVREAVRRLISDGALIMRGNRRVIVPELTESCIQQIEFMRLSLEPKLARRALTRITDDEIDRLAADDSALNQAILNGDVSGYLRQNHQFHKRIYNTAAAPIVSATVDRLWLRFSPSLRIVCGQFGTLNLPDWHAEILLAMRKRDAEGITEALENDIRQGMSQMRTALSSQTGPERFD